MELTRISGSGYLRRCLMTIPTAPLLTPVRSDNRFGDRQVPIAEFMNLQRPRRARHEGVFGGWWTSASGCNASTKVRSDDEFAHNLLVLWKRAARRSSHNQWGLSEPEGPANGRRHL